MEHVIQPLVEYWNTDRPPEPLRIAARNLGEFRLRVAIMKLLVYVGYRARSRLARPLILRPTWGEAVTRLVDSVEGLNNLFRIENGQLDYQENVDEPTRKRIEAYVAEHFRSDSDMIPFR